MEMARTFLREQCGNRMLQMFTSYSQVLNAFDIKFVGSPTNELQLLAEGCGSFYFNLFEKSSPVGLDGQ